MTDKTAWDLESDIYTNYEGTITEATFKFNEYGGQFSLTYDEIDGRENPTWENYKLPPGWESNDGGETITRISGDNKGIVKSSQFGKLLAAVAGLPGAREAIDDPLNGNNWIGCRFRNEVTAMGRGGKAYEFENDKGEKVSGVSKDKNYPVEFLGKDSSTSTGVTASATGKVDSLSVLTDLHNPVVESAIQDDAKILPYPAWFQASYKRITEAGIDVSGIPDLINAMSQRKLYESLGGKG